MSMHAGRECACIAAILANTRCAVVKRTRDGQCALRNSSSCCKAYESYLTSKVQHLAVAGCFRIMCSAHGDCAKQQDEHDTLHCGRFVNVGREIRQRAIQSIELNAVFSN